MKARAAFTIRSLRCSRPAQRLGIVAGFGELMGYDSFAGTARFGLRAFHAAYGVLWFIGSAIMGILYDHSITATITFRVAPQLTAIRVFFVVQNQCAAFLKRAVQTFPCGIKCARRERACAAEGTATMG